MNDKTPFQGKPCPHEDAECEMSWLSFGDGDGEWNLVMECRDCEAHNDYYIGHGESIPMGIEWYGGEPICENCEEVETSCDCHTCEACGATDAEEDRCDSCEHYPDDDDCSCEECAEDEEE
jgi:hypothetical protein